MRETEWEEVLVPSASLEVQTAWCRSTPCRNSEFRLPPMRLNSAEFQARRFRS